MKKLYLAIILLLAFCVQSSAQKERKQRPHFSPQEFTQKQEAFIIREAKLSPFESANFFPLYHKLGKEKFEINRKIWHLMGRAKNTGLKEKEYAEILEAADKLQIEKAKLESSYHQKFRKVLSTEKVLRVIDADIKFDRHVLKEMTRQQPKPMNMSCDSICFPQKTESGI